MTIKALVFCVLSIVCYSASAQQILVYYAEGEAFVIDGSNKTKANREVEINEKSTLKIGADGIVVLLEEEQVTLLNDTGEYSYYDLQVLFDETKPSLTGRYLNNILHQTEVGVNKETDEGKEKVGAKNKIVKGDGGIDAPEDSVLILNEGFSIDFTEQVLPGYLFIYKNKKPILHFEIDTTFLEVKYGGVLEPGKWYGFAASSNDQAPTSGIRYFKWASEVEKQSIQMEMAKILGEIETYPSQVKDDVIQAYFTANRYIYYVSKQ